MSTPVVMPQLGESVTEGTVTRWLKQVGDRVEVDEPLLEVSTDKVDTEIPAPASGFLVSIAAGEDDIVEVGGMLATIGESADAAEPAQPAQPEQPSPPPTAQPQPQPQPQNGPASGFSAPPPTGAPAPAPAAEPPAPPTPEAAPAAAPASGTEVRLPELGESVTEGTVTRWLKSVGDDVAVDEPLLEISTDKVDTEIPSPVAGTLLQIVVEEDGVVEVGGVLAVVGSGEGAPAPQPAAEPPAPAPAEPPAAPAPAAPPQPAEPTTVPAEEAEAAPEAAAADEQPPEPEPVAVAQAQAPAPAPPSVPQEAPAPPQAPPGLASGLYVTPLVRKLAADSAIDLAAVTGTGIGGRIRRQDVLAAAKQRDESAPPAAPAAATAAPPAAAAQPSPLRGRTEPMTRLRRVIADRMVESLQTSAQLTTVVEADVTGIARLRDQVKDRFAQLEGVKLSFLPFFAKAIVEALKTHPSLNASIDLEAGTVTYHDSEHLGVAVDTERGLLVPVIRDAGELNIAGLAKRIADLAERTRTSNVTPDELSGGTFTLTNTGSRGALFDTPIINQPQVAILGTGAVVKRAVVVRAPDGTDVIAIRSMMYLALTYDHRLVDGADAARFLTAVRDRLEEGEFEGELGL